MNFILRIYPESSISCLKASKHIVWNLHISQSSPPEQHSHLRYWNYMNNKCQYRLQHLILQQRVCGPFKRTKWRFDGLLRNTGNRTVFGVSAIANSHIFFGNYSEWVGNTQCGWNVAYERASWYRKRRNIHSEWQNAETKQIIPNKQQLSSRL